MKKKQLNALIDEYRATIESSPEKDFAKRERLADAAQTEPIRRKRPSYKGISLAIAVCAVIAIILPVAILLGIKNHASNNTHGGVYYASYEDITKSPIASIEVFNDTNKTHINVLPVASNGVFQEISFKSSNRVIGLSAEFIIRNQKYNILNTDIYTDKYRIENSNYSVIYQECTINEIVVRYNKSIAEDVVYVMEFEYDGYVYQAKVTCYNEVDIADIMADCFGL